jgi:hypothetical protein
MSAKSTNNNRRHGDASIGSGTACPRDPSPRSVHTTPPVGRGSRPMAPPEISGAQIVPNFVSSLCHSPLRSHRINRRGWRRQRFWLLARRDAERIPAAGLDRGTTTPAVKRSAAPSTAGRFSLVFLTLPMSVSYAAPGICEMASNLRPSEFQLPSQPHAVRLGHRNSRFTPIPLCVL